jgi:hypothetical protein
MAPETFKARASQKHMDNMTAPSSHIDMFDDDSELSEEESKATEEDSLHSSPPSEVDSNTSITAPLEPQDSEHSTRTPTSPRKYSLELEEEEVEEVCGYAQNSMLLNGHNPPPYTGLSGDDVVGEQDVTCRPESLQVSSVAAIKVEGEGAGTDQMNVHLILFRCLRLCWLRM